MGLCVNPYCDNFCQPDLQYQVTDACLSCGATFILNQRYRPFKLLKPLQHSPEIKIFEAEDVTRPDKSVILKLLDHPLPNSRSQLKREYDFLLQMSPPFLQIDLEDYFETQIHPDLPIVIYGLALPKLEGMDSHKFIHNQGKVPVAQAIQWLKQLLRFVAMMHEQGYLHRDIKPSNIMVHPDRTISLIDFGTVQKMDNDYLSIIGSHLVTETGQIQTLTRIISPGFSAPEQIEGLAVPQSDFFSMARTFIYWVTGEYPQILPMSSEGSVTWPKGVVALDGSLKSYINDMMNIAVEKRPAKASLIQHYLEIEWPKSQRYQQLMASPWLRALAAAGLLSVVVVSYFFLSFALSRFFFYRGSDYVFNGQYKKAQKDLSLSLKIDPEFEDAHHNFASLCQEIQDYDCALHHHQKALELDADRWQSHYNLGSLREDLNQFKQAKEAYQKAIELSQSQALEPLNNLARVEILLEQPEAAIALLQQAQPLASDSGDLALVTKNLGWAFLEQNQSPKALQALQESQDLNPNLADTYCLMAQLYDQQNQAAEANNNWIACLSLQSNSRDVLKWREDFIRQNFQEESDQP